MRSCLNDIIPANIMKMSSSFQKSITIVVFFISVLWYFFPIGSGFFPTDMFALRLELPAAALAFGGVGLLPWVITLGFVFCTVGDAMGVAGSFEGQMGGFAIAQICFIMQFIKEIRQYVKTYTQHKYSSVGPVIATLICMVPLIFAARNILPEVGEMHLRIGCVVYALLLLTTVWTSIVRAFFLKKYVAMIGCIIFLISDFKINCKMVG